MRRSALFPAPPLPPHTPPHPLTHPLNTRAHTHTPVGTRRTKYLEENLGAAEVQLSAEDLQELAETFPYEQVP